MGFHRFTDEFISLGFDLCKITTAKYEEMISTRDDDIDSIFGQEKTEISRMNAGNWRKILCAAKTWNQRCVGVRRCDVLWFDRKNGCVFVK